MLEKLKLYSSYNEVDRETLRRSEQDKLLCELYLIIEISMKNGYIQGFKDAGNILQAIKLNEK